MPFAEEFDAVLPAHGKGAQAAQNGGTRAAESRDGPDGDPAPLAAASREIFILRLRPEPRVHGVRSLRALLKVALRRFGLRCVSVGREP